MKTLYTHKAGQRKDRAMTITLTTTFKGTADTICFELVDGWDHQTVWSQQSLPLDKLVENHSFTMPVGGETGSRGTGMPSRIYARMTPTNGEITAGAFRLKGQ